jgi:hypothetical protein
VGEGLAISGFLPPPLEKPREPFLLLRARTRPVAHASHPACLRANAATNGAGIREDKPGSETAYPGPGTLAAWLPGPAAPGAPPCPRHGESCPDANLTRVHGLRRAVWGGSRWGPGDVRSATRGRLG